METELRTNCAEARRKGRGGVDWLKKEIRPGMNEGKLTMERERSEGGKDERRVSSFKKESRKMLINGRNR